MNQPKPQADPRWTALVAGGNGLVGSRLLEALAGTWECARAIAVTRRPLVYDHPKVANRIVRFEKLEESLAGAHADVAFCCLGTTIKTAGSQEAFRQVDFDYTLAFARAALKAGVKRFVLNSSVGADPDAKTFYLRVKGETEAAVAQVGFASLDILQPSLLLGVRSELRPAELVMMGVLPIFSPLMLGKSEQFRPIRASVVAAAMIGVTHSGRKGIHRHTWRAIHELAARKAPRR
jgi:uncharacterized protein YbjT (DUF2867 family)